MTIAFDKGRHLRIRWGQLAIRWCLTWGRLGWVVRAVVFRPSSGLEPETEPRLEMDSAPSKQWQKVLAPPLWRGVVSLGVGWGAATALNRSQPTATNCNCLKPTANQPNRRPTSGLRVVPPLL